MSGTVRWTGDAIASRARARSVATRSSAACGCCALVFSPRFACCWRCCGVAEWSPRVANDNRHAGDRGSVSRRVGMDWTCGRRRGTGRRCGDCVRCRASPRRGRMAGRTAGARVHASREQDLARGARRRHGAFRRSARCASRSSPRAALANAWYLVGDVPALIGTDYGRLLLAKLALFAAMLVLAMANRWYLSVRLPQARIAKRCVCSGAMRSWKSPPESASSTIVGALGVTVPAAPSSPGLALRAHVELGSRLRSNRPGDR